MAEYGQIRIGTKIDTAGIATGAKAVQKEMTSLRRSIEGTIPDDAFSNLQKALSATEKELNNFKAHYASMSKDGRFHLKDLNDQQRKYYEDTKKGADDLRKSLESINTETDGSFTSFLNNIKTWQVAVVGASVAIANVIKSSIDNFGRIDDMSQQLGMSRGEFQKWDYVAKQSGINIESLGVAMKTLSDNAVGGSKALQTLGVSAKDSNGNFKSQEQLFNETISALSKMPAGVQRTSLSVDLFGRSAMDLATVLNLTNEELDTMRNDAPIFSDEEIMAGDKLGDTLQAIKDNLIALASTSLVALSEPLQVISDTIKEMTKQGSDTSEALKSVGSAIASILTALAPIVKVLTEIIAPIIKFIADGINKIAKGVEYAAGGFGLWGKNMKDIFGEKALSSIDQYDRKIANITKKISDYKSQGKEGEGLWWWQKAADDAPYVMQKWIDAEQKKLDEIKAQREEFLKGQSKPSVSAKADSKSSWIEGGNEVERFLADRLKPSVKTTDDGVKQLIQDFQNLGATVSGNVADGFGNAAEAMGEFITKGGNVGDLVMNLGKMMVESAVQAYSGVADQLIAWGTLALVAPSANAAMGYPYNTGMLYEGLAMKVTAGMLKGMLKYATGGIVPGSSYSGDNVLARVNSGEMILNAAQQSKLYDIANGASGSGGVNIQIINNTDSQVSASSDNQGNIKVLIESVVLDTLGNKKGAAVLKNNYNLKKQGA